MIKKYLLFASVVVGCLAIMHSNRVFALNVSMNFSTYFGGSNGQDFRDVCVDSQGYIYVTGGTNSQDFPTTLGAYQETYSGSTDIFVAKFSPDGQLVWSTLVGGWDYDRAYAIEVDNRGYVYVGGRGGSGAPITPGAVQETFKGEWGGGPYQSDMNAYIFKLSSDGSKLEWATYFGTGHMFRDIDIDQNGNVYGVWHDPLNSANPYRDTWKDPAWFANAFQLNPQGGNGDFGVVKISSDGTQVIWATYLTGSGGEAGAGSVRVDANEYVYVATYTSSSDMPTTPGAYDTTLNGVDDCYVAKLEPDGSNIVFGTYLGGSGGDLPSTHNMAIDNRGNSYVSVWTDSPDFPTTPGAFQRTYGGGYSDMAVAKFSPTGSLIASTFIGGNQGENADGIYVDGSENVYLSGYSRSVNFPVTSDAFQKNFGGVKDSAFVVLSSDFSQLLYSTFIGGSNRDDARSSCLAADGTWHVIGNTASTDWPIKNALQTAISGGNNGFLAKFNILNIHHPADPDSNNVISMLEILGYIDQWAVSDVTMLEVLEGLDLWAAGHYYWDESEQIFKPG